MGLLVSLIISIVIPFLLYVLGEVTKRLGNTESKIKEPKASETHNWYDKGQRGGLLSILIPTMLAYPKFYMVFFVLFPVFYGIFAGRAAQVGSAPSFFVADFEGRDLNRPELVAHEYLWIATYFLSGVPFCTFLQCFEALITKFGWSKLYNFLPFQYAERIQLNFATFGGSMLITGTLILHSDQGDDGEGQEDIDKLFRASIAVCWALAYSISYKGFVKLFDGFYFGTMPSVKFFWWCGHITAVGFTVVNLALTNEIAGIILAASYGGFGILPTIVWLLSSKAAKLPGGAESRKTQNVDVVGQPKAHRELNYARFAVLKGVQDLGVKHWVYNLTRPFYFPLSGFAVKVPTQSDANARLLTVIPLLEPTFFGASGEGWMGWVRPFLTPFILPFILLALLTHQIKQKVGDIYMSLTTDKNLFVFVTPPVGRSISTSEYTKVVYMVDGPGVLAAAGYFQSALAATNNEFSDQTFNFVFKVDNIYDYATLCYVLKQMLEGEADYAVNKGTVEFSILLTGGCKPSEISSMLSKENREAFKDMVQSRTEVNPNLSFVNVNMGELLKGAKESDTAVVAVGSSLGCLEVRSMLKSRRDTKKIDFFDAVFEDSIYRTATQTDPF